MKSPFSFTRRSFVKNSMIAAGLPLTSSVNFQKEKKVFVAEPNTVPLAWLDKQISPFFKGTTWGTPWAKGLYKKGTEFTLKSNGNDIPTQTWPLAY